ncbi:putative quinol monooxygenase [Nocardiopsis terrae]
MKQTTASPYEVTARIRCTDPDRVEPARTALGALAEQTRSEPGCLAFSVHEETEAPGSFVLWEVFADEEAFRRHFEYQHTRSYLEHEFTEVVEHWVMRPV